MWIGIEREMVKTVISFMVKEARKHLEEKGFVCTLRPFKRKYTGESWYNYFRGDTKKGEVYIQFIREIIDPEELQVYAYYSGVETLEDWLKAAKGSKYLYWVRLL